MSKLGSLRHCHRRVPSPCGPRSWSSVSMHHLTLDFSCCKHINFMLH
uniref:Uncharacterized protein n=1 Tax=Setaria viridis TaxID=4556 RepID=A0A4U6V042_SETVI|nr:hypothetical protein SEVIR_4G225301v2 [Setaria viridis]